MVFESPKQNDKQNWYASLPEKIANRAFAKNAVTSSILGNRYKLVKFYF